jgi:hypothetical protein
LKKLYFLRYTWGIHLFTYSLTPWSRVVLEKLRGSQLVMNFPAFYRTRRVRHLSLSRAISSQFRPPIPLPEDPSKYYPPIYAWAFQVVYFLQVSPPKPCVYISFPPYVLHAPPVSFSKVFKTYFVLCGIRNFTYCVRKSPPLFSALI